MKILFIKSVVNADLFSCDFGIGSLTSDLKKHHHEVDLFIFRTNNDSELLDQKIASFKPDIIAFSTYASSFPSTLKISQYVHKHYPKLYQICGGVHVILNPFQTISQGKFFDAICIGEGENIFPEFLSKLKNSKKHYQTSGFWVRHQGRIYKNSPPYLVPDLDKLDFPDRDILIRQGVQNYESITNNLALTFLFSRGCPFNCTFCSNEGLKKAFGSHNFLRSMSPKKAIEWIKEDIGKYAYESLVFQDDTFTWDHKWLKEFLSLYQPIGIPFFCNTRVDSIDFELMKELKTAGCAGLLFGIESGNPEVRNKILKKNTTQDQIKNAFKMAHQLNLKTMALLMIGLPEESTPKFVETIRLCQEIKPDSFSIGIFYPYPGTELFSYAQKHKLLRPSSKTSSFVERRDTALNLPTFSRRDILYFHQNFYELSRYFHPQNNLLSKIHCETIISLYTIAPSSFLFPLCQFLINTDTFLRSLKKVYSYS